MKRSRFLFLNNNNFYKSLRKSSNGSFSNAFRMELCHPNSLGNFSIRSDRTFQYILYCLSK